MADIVVLSLAVWRTAALLCYDDLFHWLRMWAKVDFTDSSDRPITFVGRVLSCFWCASLVAVLFVFLLWETNCKLLVYMLASSGGAIILHHWTRIVRDVANK